MFADHLKKKHLRSIYLFGIAESIPAIVFLILFFTYKPYAKMSLIVLIGLAVFTLIMYIFLFNRRINKTYELRFKITSLDHAIPFPSSFKKQLRTLLIDGKRGYTINKKIIPAKFVEFVEGKRAYLIKELTCVHETNIYKVLYVHELTYALIEDVDHKKWLIHMNCLELINA